MLIIARVNEKKLDIFNNELLTIKKMVKQHAMGHTELQATLNDILGWATSCESQPAFDGTAYAKFRKNWQGCSRFSSRRNGSREKPIGLLGVMGLCRARPAKDTGLPKARLWCSWGWWSKQRASGQPAQWHTSGSRRRNAIKFGAASRMGLKPRS